jgi:hypothetical protein
MGPHPGDVAGKLLDESDVSERVVLAKLDCNEHQK